MKNLSITSLTSVHDLATLFESAKKSDGVYAKEKGGITVLYVREWSLWNALKETFIPEFQKQAKQGRNLAKKKIMEIITNNTKAIGPTSLSAKVNLIGVHLRAHQPNRIQLVQIREQINELVTSINSIVRIDVTGAWQASLNELRQNSAMSRNDGIGKLINIGHMNEEEKDALTELVHKADQQYEMSEIEKDIGQLNQFMRAEGTDSSTDDIDFSRIKKFALAADKAISRIDTKKLENYEVLNLLDKEPLNSAKLFFSKIPKPITNTETAN